MDKSGELRRLLSTLLHQQQFAVLATKAESHPHTSLVAFACTDDLKQLCFATHRDTRKFANLASDGRVALLIDNRSHTASDYLNAIAVTATGVAEEASPDERGRLFTTYIQKHKHLRDFVEEPECALVKVDVSTYYVSEFQKVSELRV